MVCAPLDTVRVSRDNVACPATSATGTPVATLSTRNCTVPVGVASVPEVPETTLTVRLMFVPCTTEVSGDAVSVVTEAFCPSVATVGVTRLQLFTKLKTSSVPSPVARS